MPSWRLADAAALPIQAELDKKVKDVKDKAVGEVVRTMMLRMTMPGIGPDTVPALTELVVQFNGESDSAFTDGQGLLLVCGFGQKLL